jgi:serine/threonine protein kinase/Flp pilus assembly protein TadD
MSDTPTAGGGDDAGQRFGDFVLVNRIAQGGMAELFLAKRRGVEGFEKTVAIKRILPELSWNREFVSMFINEAKIAARLSHPNIVQIFDFGKIDTYYFIAMEYVHGENLREILKRSAERGMKISGEIAASIVARACAGLDHAHRKTDETGRPLRIIHRDVSPQNVLVSYDGDVKVVDFGIAKAAAESPEATRGVLKGKLAYLSPEQVSGANLDARSDIFATGLVFYELLVGRKLFDNNDPAEILDAIMHIDSAQVSKSIPNLDKSLREVLRRSLHVDPNQRYNSAGEMQAAIDRYLRESGDPGGTLQLSNLMRLLFDQRMGEKTAEMLRQQVFGTRDTLRSGSGLRLAAAVAGAVLGAGALVFAEPYLRPSGPDPGSSGPRQADKTGVVNAVPTRAESHTTKRPPSPEPTTQVSSATTATTEPGAKDTYGRETTAKAAAAPAPRSAEIAAAETALGANRPGDAIAAYEKAFTESPDLRDKHATSYAKALIEDGKARFDADADAAAERFQAAAKADPDSFDAHFFLAKLDTRRGDPQSAQREYLEAIRINPKSADAQFNLGFVYFSQKRYEDALRQYEKVVTLKPPYLADVFYNLSACYEQMKRKSDAIAALRRGLVAVPGSELLRQRLKQLGG